MAERYRDFVRPSLIDAGMVDDGGAAQLRQIAEVFKSFENSVADFGTRLAARRGAREGAAAGASGAPRFKSDAWASVNAYAEAYNNAALRSYAIRAEVDAEDTAARLEVEAGTDPEVFRATFGKVQSEVLKVAPSQARAVIDEVYTRRLGAGVARLSEKRAVEQRNQARTDVAEGIARLTDRIANLRTEDTLEAHAQADEEEVKLQLLIDGARTDGTITEVEAGTHAIDASRSITKQTVVARFRRVLKDPYGDPVAFIRRLKDANRTSEALPPEEEAKLEAELLAELSEENALRTAERQNESHAREARYAEGDRVLTGELLTGRLTRRRLQEASENDEADPTVLRTLLNELTNPPPPKSDPAVLFDYSTNLLSYEEEEIKTARGLTWADRQALILKRREWASGWRGTQEGREAADRIDRALGIVPGIMNRMLSDHEKKQRERALTEWYNTVDALPEDERQASAIKVAEEVIKRVVVQTAVDKVERLRRERAEFVRAAGPVDAMREYERNAYNERLAEFDKQIDAQEKKAK